MRRFKKLIYNSIFDERILDCLLITSIIYIKSMIFMFILLSNNSSNIKFEKLRAYWGILVPFLLALLLGVIILMFKRWGRAVYFLGVNIIITIIFILDLHYFRTYNNFLAVSQIFNSELFNILDKNIFSFKIVDLLLITDFIVIFPLCIRRIKKIMSVKID